ncbi:MULTISPECIES: T7SS effector LXG polymorphic toxin [unclassified Enterococcus]|uniref:T7SS effector LXG polymorphic toxin n=1 Tax=unclassified Enterococcus TaxID=2608891 RepID=UPI001CE03427|nr:MULTISPECIES: T7SS effector LXG polymorphic toxin [unclassified Enterococcus]MCA5014396.1 hypothetical protein [Enterococcus sp. S23]MCA5017491.1 hypothetical protein [Enterococcus sp. S22(2020)]
MTKIDYSELTSVQQTVQRARLAILDHFNPFNTTINEFSGESELTGDSWDSAKNYLTQLPPIVTGVFNTLAEVGETLDLYLSSFQAEVGSPKNRLDSEELIDLNNRLNSIKSEKASILAEIQRGANMVKYGPQTTMFGTSFSSLGTTALDNSIEDLNKDIEILEKYVSFEAAHANDFSTVQDALTQLKTGLPELNRSVSFEAGTGNFSTISLKDKEWYKNIGKYNETQPTERLEMVKTYKAMYRENGTLLGYEVVYEIYRNGERNEELTTKMTDMMREAQLGELGNFILETTGINDFYRYFNGVDPITGEKLTNNQRSLSGLLGLLGAVSTAEGIKMLTNLQKGYAMMQGVDIADDIARASTVSDDILVDSYKNLRTNKDTPGQAHHLNQDAAFRDYIPKNDGLAVKLEGNIFTDIGSPHYNAHESLEGFWNNYRKNGELLGLKPSLSDYNAALKQSLLNAGLSEAQADAAVLKAAAQQANAGLFSDDFIPRIPGRINLPKPKP